jgi:hypothetical protein
LTYPVHLAFEKCKNVTLHPVDGRKYSVFEIDIYTEEGRFVFSSHGRYMDFYDKVDEPVYGDYKCLQNNLLKVQTDRIETELTAALNSLVQNCIDKIEGREELICTGDDALAVHKIYDVMEVK